jgi:DNA-binding HxlR family transcriptional regulator
MQNCARSECPVSHGLDLFGDKWSLLIVRDLFLNGRQRYQDFLNSGERIATNILADRLARLEKYGLIRKSGDPSNKKQKFYSLTKRGLDLSPVLTEMIVWGLKYSPDSARRRAFLKRMKRGEAAVRKEIRWRFRTHAGRPGQNNLK